MAQADTAYIYHPISTDTDAGGACTDPLFLSDLKHPYDGVFEFAERFDSVLDALGKPSSNVPFLMPARIASMPAEVQIKEVIGGGPFRFVKEEWQANRLCICVIPITCHATRCRADQPVAGRYTSIR